MKSQTVKQGEVVTEPTPAPTKTNSIFEGWYTDKTYATEWKFTDPVNQDMTLYAKWKAETANVKVSEKDGNHEYGTVTVEKGTPITSDKLSTVTVEKKGYTVEKWVTSDGKDWDVETDNVTEEMEIHPVWKLNDPEVNLSAEGNVTKVHTGNSVKLIAEALNGAEGTITYRFKWYKGGEELELKKSKSKVSSAAESKTNEITVDESGKYTVKVIASDDANRSSGEVESNLIEVEIGRRMRKITGMYVR